MNPFTFFSKLARTLVAITSLVVATERANAQGIRILDCNGQTRAIHQIPTSIDYVVLVRIVDGRAQPKESSEITLTNKERTVRAVTDEDGVAEFVDIDPGVWLVGTPEKGLYYSAITLSDSVRGGFWREFSETAVDVLKVTAIAGVAVGAGVLIHEATDGSSNGSDDNGSGGGMPGGDCTSCDPDVSAPSVPGFRQR